MIAICAPPWEIVPNIFIEFPVKVKAIVNFETGFQEFAFAGGFQLGSDPSTALEAYTQVLFSSFTCCT